MELISPTPLYKDTFLDALDEYENAEQHQRYADLSRAREVPFEQYVAELRGQEKGEYLPEGYVPCTTYWLMDRGEFIGRVSIRHRLSEHLLRIGGHIGYDIRPSKRQRGYGTMILQLVLPKAKELGIDRALVTCDDTNIGSRRIIEKAGGVLENSVPQGPGMPDKLRFWITT
jgi:predicted acetyltransferase